ncbi:MULTISPECIES: hypothetical protein [Roseomonadaceae]|uniref:Tetratricopeptide repeat protein n=1 Tax=Falsiroseomonas oleicola TaxID=2801474 RepID=A0ABS6H3K6_9PROT|nr:hypothetical protein [Roseomonas oleicola]MBU8543241.1 hypothetical protein [Roseomonas oleicola]
MRAAVLALLALTACGGRAPPPGPPRDAVLDRAADAAGAALDQEQPRAAARLFAQGLERARQRDDPAAIDSMAFGQAIAELEHGQAPAALRVARQVRLDLARRGRGASAGLMLAEATALYRLGQRAEAGVLARFVAARGAENPEAALRAQFLLGLMAAEARDLPGLAAAQAAIGQPDQAAYQADAAELAAQAALLRGAPQAAWSLAQQAEALRRDALDYRGLSRVLALRGAAARALGATAEAADLHLRAAEGAAGRGEVADARRWLAEAEVLGSGDPALLAAIARVRALLPAPV